MTRADWIASVAAAAGVLAVVVAVFALRYARRSADSARRSAAEASRLADIEEDRREEERERRHEELAPDLPGDIAAVFRETGCPGYGPITGVFHGTVRIPRAYRMRVYAVADGAWRPIGGSQLTTANQLIQIEFRQGSDDSFFPPVEEIVFQFWPPEAADDVSLWTCRCGRPSTGSSGGPGHWEHRMWVAYPAIETPSSHRVRR